MAKNGNGRDARSYLTRTPVKPIQLAGRTLLPTTIFAQKSGRPSARINAWTKLAENPLPSITLPAADGSRGGITYIDEIDGLNWILSYASNAPPRTRKRGRPRKHNGK